MSMSEKLYLIRNVDRLIYAEGADPEPYITSRESGLPLVVEADMVPAWADRLEPVPKGTETSREWLDHFAEAKEAADVEPDPDPNPTPPEPA